MVILGIVGRICSGKETIGSAYQDINEIPFITLKNWDLRQLFGFEKFTDPGYLDAWIKAH